MERVFPSQIDKGSSGWPVFGLQCFLIGKGYSAEGTLVPDGVFGVKTEMAIRQYQANLGLEVDGRVGPATQEQLIKDGLPIGSIPDLAKLEQKIVSAKS